MTGVGETLQPLSLPKMPCVMVNPGVPVATSAVFKALGLRNGELRVGVTDVLLQDRWPNEDTWLEDWVEALAASSNDLEAPALRVQPVIGEVIAALDATNGTGWRGCPDRAPPALQSTRIPPRPAARRRSSGAITPHGGCMRERSS